MGRIHQDLTGLKFGRFTVLGLYKTGGAKVLWWCRCDCGNEKAVRVDGLKSGNSKSCGCLTKEVARSKFIDLRGQRFGRWIVIEKIGAIERQGVRWKCKCDCGNEKIVPSSNLRNGSSKSCGCLHKEKAAEIARHAGYNNRKHGMTGSPEYIIWSDMRQRCLDKNDKDFHRYGGRGIKICERWSEFGNFYEDMGPKPSPKHSIDRINGDGNYEPSNCRWVTWVEQQRNRSNNINLTYLGKTQCITAWAEEYNISMQALWQKIRKCKWDIGAAIDYLVAKKKD